MWMTHWCMEVKYATRPTQIKNRLANSSLKDWNHLVQSLSIWWRILIISKSLKELDKTYLVKISRTDLPRIAWRRIVKIRIRITKLTVALSRNCNRTKKRMSPNLILPSTHKTIQWPSMLKMNRKSRIARGWRIDARRFSCFRLNKSASLLTKISTVRFCTRRFRTQKIHILKISNPRALVRSKKTSSAPNRPREPKTEKIQQPRGFLSKIFWALEIA